MSSTVPPHFIGPVQVLAFPPCFSEQEMVVFEMMMFGLFSQLKRFIRGITVFEREAGAHGLEPGMNAVLVRRDAEHGSRRTYGTMILLREVPAL